MRKLFAVALLSLAAFGFSVAPASAGWFCHKCHQHLGACATQYNAFSPFCVQGVYTSHHGHKCVQPAEGPCCNGGWDDCACANGACAGPATITHGEGTTQGVLPAPAVTTVQPAPQPTIPQAPAPLPTIPGATSQLISPATPPSR